jgi:hypothetical protein
MSVSKNQFSLTNVLSLEGRHVKEHFLAARKDTTYAPTLDTEML